MGSQRIWAQAGTGVRKFVVCVVIGALAATSQILPATAAGGVAPTISNVGPIVAQNGTVSPCVTTCVTGTTIVINGTGFGATAPMVQESPNIGGVAKGSSALGVQAKTNNLEIADTTTGSFMGLAGSPRGFFSANDCYVTIGSWSDTRIIVLLDDTGLVRSLNRCSDITEGHTFTVKVWNTDDQTASALFDAGKALALGPVATVTHLSPASGPTTGGTLSDPAGPITVTGTNLTGASIVWFGDGESPGAGIAVTEFTVNAEGTSITVVPPASPLGRDLGVFVNVTTPAGTSAVQCSTIIQGCEGTYYYQSPSKLIPTIDGSTGPLNIEGNLSAEIPISTPGACPSGTPLPSTGVSISASAKVTGGPVSFKGIPQTSTNGVLSSFQVPLTVTVENPVVFTLTLTGKIAGCFAVPIPGLSIAGIGGVYVLIGGSLEVGYTLTATLNKGTFAVNVGIVPNQISGVVMPADGQKCVDANGAAAPCLETRSSGFLTGTLYFSPLWIQLNIGAGPLNVQAGAGLLIAATVTLSTETGIDYDVCFGGSYTAALTVGPKTFSTSGLLFGPFNIYGNGLKCPLGPIGAGLPPSSVTVTSSSNPTAPGAAVTYTATVTPTANGGTVSFADNSSLIATCQSVPVDATGKAVCQQTYAAAGVHSIGAAYSGGAALAGSSSTLLKQTVSTTGSEPPTPPTPPNPPVDPNQPTPPTPPVDPNQPVPPTSVATFTPAVPERLLDTRIPIGYTGPKPVAGQTVILQVTGAGTTKVPAGASAVVLNLTGAQATDSGFVTVWPCDAARPLASNLNLVKGATTANLVTVKLSATGTVCVYTQAGAHLIADIAGHYPAGSSFKALVPERLLDTRLNGPQVGYHGSRPTEGQTIELLVASAGASKVPATASAVVLNITATEVADSGFVTVWPCDVARPLASNLNLTRGATTPNLVTVKLSATGTVCIYTESRADFIADIAGYYPVGSNFIAVVPERLLDTRVPLGYTGAKPLGGQTVVLKVTGAGATNAPSNAIAVVVNVTGTESTGDGFVTVWPCDSARPTVSNLNLVQGATTPNHVIVKLSAAGTICLYLEPSAHLVADISGYFR